MKPRWVIARKEFAGVFTERTILLAVVIQVFVAGFSSFLVVGLSALVDPQSLPSALPSAVVLDPEAAEDDALLAHLEQAGLRVVTAPDDQTAWEFFHRDLADAAVFKQRLNASGQSPDQPVALTLVLPEGDFRTTLTLVQVKDALEAYERELRDERQARLQFEPVYLDTDAKGGSFAFVYSLLIPLLVFLPVVLAGALCADSLTEEVQRKTLPLLLVSPATAADVVEGKLLANVALAPLLSLAWFLLLALNDLPVPWLGAVAICLLATAIAYLLGLLACVIALATRDRNKAHVLYATAMFLLLALSLALPVSPVNAVALFAAGSAGVEAWAVVAAFSAAAVAGGLALRVALRRTQQWLAAGGA